MAAQSEVRKSYIRQGASKLSTLSAFIRVNIPACGRQARLSAPTPCNFPRQSASLSLPVAGRRVKTPRALRIYPRKYPRLSASTPFRFY
ncbi:MAG: hypothetical protein HYV25_03025 [Candidatus Harrisonbacteria bacterium]|nr:hypothetical protein [Candidatus Harrisonbacteria bacterium]